MSDLFDYMHIEHLSKELDWHRKWLEEAKERLVWLDCLETAGVDNWEGIDHAKKLYEEGYDE